MLVNRVKAERVGIVLGELLTYYFIQVSINEGMAIKSD